MASDLLPDAPERVRRLRAGLGLTRARFAARLGVSTLSIMRWEDGRARPSALAWRLIERAESEGGGAETSPERITGRRPVPATVFVGRERELALLRERLELACEGRAGVVLVSGEPGAGKTRLLIELATRAQADGWRVLFERAYESEGMPPYLPFAEPLRDYVRSCRPAELRALVGTTVNSVALLVPELRDRIPAAMVDRRRSPPENGEAQPAWARYLLHEGITDFLLAIARSAKARGLLLVLDDLHWADQSTLLLFQHLVRRAAGAAPLLIAGSYRSVGRERPHPLDGLLASLSRDQSAEALQLEPLTVDEIRCLIASASGTAPATAAAEALCRWTGGTPSSPPRPLQPSSPGRTRHSTGRPRWSAWRRATSAAVAICCSPRPALTGRRVRRNARVRASARRQMLRAG